MNFKKKVSGSWTDTPHYIHNTSTDTITTLPAVLYPTGTTATVGLKGNMYQASGVSPTTPIQPQGTGERTGNLLNLSSYSGTSAGISDIVINGNSITFNASSQFLAIVYEFNLGIADIYILSLGGDSYHTRLEIRYLKNGSTVGSAIVIQPNQSATISGSDEYDGFRIYISNANNIGTCTASNVMLNSGSTALPYEPYGYEIPILSNSQTTNVYLGEVQSTRKVKKLVLDGTENWTYRSGDPANVFFMYLPTAKTGEVAMSNAYPYYSGTDFVDMNDKEFAIIRSSLGIRNSDYQYESQFKAYLAQQYAAGTPVTVWYALATPETAVVNEPLRKIGDYADEVSGITIPTIAGANTISVNTTLQPSEVTATYKSWHPVADVHVYPD